MMSKNILFIYINIIISILFLKNKILLKNKFYFYKK